MNFIPNKWSFLKKRYEQKAIITRPKIEEHMLNVMDKSTHEEHLSQPLQLIIINLKQLLLS